jgi:aspartate racemase
MKTIGLLGGMSWESTVTYYQIINEAVKAKLGGLHSAKCVLYSVDFAEIELMQHEGRWEEAAQCLVTAGQGLQRAGAELVVLCTNTMHKLADTIQAGLCVPFLHVADATALQIKRAGVQRVGLLGTRFTMEEDFFQGRLARQFNLDTIVPDALERKEVHRIIYEELCLGIIRPESRICGGRVSGMALVTRDFKAYFRALHSATLAAFDEFTLTRSWRPAVTAALGSRPADVASGL